MKTKELEEGEDEAAGGLEREKMMRWAVWK